MRIQADNLTDTQASNLLLAGYTESISTYGPMEAPMFRVGSRELTFDEGQLFMGIIAPVEVQP